VADVQRAIRTERGSDIEQLASVIGEECGRNDRALREHFASELGQARAHFEVQVSALKREIAELKEGRGGEVIPRFLGTNRHAATH